jgi:protein phosphatase
MYCKLDQEHGPFDLIGDIHGCHAELIELLDQLGYEATHQELGSDGSLRDAPTFHHPQGRKAVFLGDLVDRGPGILNTLRVVHNMVEAGTAFCVIGNHDDKLLRKLKGRNVQISHGLENTLAEIEALPSSVRNHFERDVQHFLEALPNHYILDQSRLVIAHAGIKEELHGTATERTRSFALYGETTGQKDEYGLPVRGNWPVVYGHTPVPEPAWQNNTVNIDTGCVFGGKLTALRYPEMEIVSVVAKDVYYPSAKPFPRASLSSH